MCTTRDELQNPRQEVVSTKSELFCTRREVVATNDAIQKTRNQNLEKLRKSVDRTSQMILAAIYFVGFIVCVGTPVVGILVFKFRKEILEMFKQEPNLEDEKVIALTTNINTRKTYTSMKSVSAPKYKASGN